MGQGKALEVFISYSRQDDPLRQKLETHLATLERQGQVKPWHGAVIEAGAEWAAEIKSHLESAQMILLLISPDFIASDSCYDFELRRALERHQAGTARVIPVILRPVFLDGTPFSHLACLPQDGQPITQWKDQDEAFLDVVKGLYKTIASLSIREPTNLIENRPIPPLLAYLTDRSEQEDRLSEILQQLLYLNSPQPVVCIVHGDEFQCHDTFVDCLRYVYLPKLLRQVSITSYHLRWPTRLTSLTELHSRLRKNLAGEVTYIHSFASLEEINEHLAKNPNPVMIHTHLLTEDWQAQGSQIVEEFLRFWQQWPVLSGHQTLIIFLFIKYQVKRNLGWFRRRQFKAINQKILRELDVAANSRFEKLDCLIGGVLPQLTDVKQAEVENWAYREEIIKFWGKERRKLFKGIEQLFEDWEVQSSLSEIPMEDLAQLLTELWSKHCPAGELL